MTRSTVRILHTNDLHGTLDDRREDVLATVRSNHNFYFDTGDCIKTGNLGIPLRPEPVWKRLAALHCTGSVPGNRESHILRSAFDAKIAGHRHPILCSNMFDRAGEAILPPSLELEVEGRRVAVVGVMVPMVTERMKTQALSQMIWTAPLPAVQEEVCRLRPLSDLVIVLSHLGLRLDRKMAETVPGVDLILGGHSHSHLDPPERIGNVWICQAGSHGKFYGSYEWSFGQGLTEYAINPF